MKAPTLPQEYAARIQKFATVHGNSANLTVRPTSATQTEGTKRYDSDYGLERAAH